MRAERFELGERRVEFASIIEPRDDARARLGARLFVPFRELRCVVFVEDDVEDDVRAKSVRSVSRAAPPKRREPAERVESRA